MKIKGSVKKMPAIVPVLAAVIPGAALIALRLMQSLNSISPETGFFYDRSDFTVTLFYILAGCAALLPPVLAYLCPLSRAEGFASEKRPLHALFCLLFAVAIVWDILVYADLFTNRQNDFLFFVRIDDGSFSVLTAGNKLFSGTNSRLPAATCIAGFLACVSLVVCASAFFLGRPYTKKARLLHIFPVFWAMCKTMSYLPINVSFLQNSALLLCIFGDMFLMIFLFEYARKVTGIAGDGNSPSYLATALSAAVFQLAAAVTGIVGMLPGRTPFLYAEFAPYRIAAALFCITAVAVLLRDTAPDYVPGPKPEPAAQPQEAPAADEAEETADEA